MRVGFTGTQKGLRPPQALQLEAILESLAPMEEFHHGDCIGADKEADERAMFAGVRRTHAHPCELEEKRAHCPCDVIHPVKHHKVRNRDIVDACDLLIACPRGPEAALPYSGTWQTVRIARSAMARRPSLRIIIIWPDGRVEPEERAHDGLLQHTP